MFIVPSNDARGRIWRPWEVEFLRRFYPTHANEALAVVLGTNAQSIKNKACNLGLRKAARRMAWTPEADQLLRALYPNTLSHKLAEQLGCDVESVFARAHKIGLRKRPGWMKHVAQLDADARRARAKASGFKPGHKPWNTGLKGFSAPGRSAETRFKPGRPADQAANYRPIGSEKYCPKRKTLVRKVTDDPVLKPVNRWRPVHRMVWEAANGPVPAGSIVIFKRGMKTLVSAEITLDRLELVTLRENMARNTVHNLPTPLKGLIRARATLNRSINRLEKQV